MLEFTRRGEQDDRKSYKNQVKVMFLYNIEKTHFIQREMCLLEKEKLKPMEESLQRRSLYLNRKSDYHHEIMGMHRNFSKIILVDAT